MTQRIGALDALKGWLIFLVVFGHVVGAAAHLAPAEGGGFLFHELYKWIYLFHMSAFFFVSGVVFREWSDFGASCLRLARRLLVPYFVFGLATLLLFVVVGAAFVPETSYYAHKFAASLNWMSVGELLYGGAVRRGVEPFVYNSVLWFLPVLFAVDVLYAGWRRMVGGRGEGAASTSEGWKADLGLAVTLVVISWFVRTRVSFPLPFGLARALYYLPFFILGRHFPFASFAAEGGRGVRCARWACLLALVLYSCAAGLVPDLWLQVANFGYHVLFLALAAFGIAVSLAVAVVLNVRLVRLCGMASLTIMLLHKPIVVALQFVCPPVRALYGKGLAVGLLASIAIALVSMALCLVADRALRKWAPWAVGLRG